MAAAVQSGLYQASYNTCAASAIEELLKDLRKKNRSGLQILNQLINGIFHGDLMGFNGDFMVI